MNIYSHIGLTWGIKILNIYFNFEHMNHLHKGQARFGGLIEPILNFQMDWVHSN